MKIMEIKMKKKRIWKLKKVRSHFHKRISKLYFFENALLKYFMQGVKIVAEEEVLGFIQKTN